MGKSAEEKIKFVREVAEDLRKKAKEKGFIEPFVSWVTDLKGGILILDAPPASDMSSRGTPKRWW